MEFSHSSTKSGHSFHKPLKQEELQSLGYKNFAPDTMKKVRWVTKMYREWRNHRNSIGGGEQILCDLDCKETISEESLTYALCRFITEVKKKLMEVNIRLKLYDITICVQFHLETMGFAWKILNQVEFKEIRFTLDNVMKICLSQ